MKLMLRLLLLEKKLRNGEGNDDIVFYEVVMEKRKYSEAYLVTENLKHFPKRSFIVDPTEMLEIMGRVGM